MHKDRTYLATPIGNLEISGTEKAVEKIIFVHMLSDLRSCCPGINTIVDFKINNDILSKSSPVAIASLQLSKYFKGELRQFDFPIAPKGTEFQLMVWNELKKIEFGQTISYSAIAEKIGNPKASRAVGSANNKNPLPIVIPCHRVIGNDRSLTGYAGGLWRKKWLLEFEASSLEKN